MPTDAFGYTGSEQTWTAPYTQTITLRVWGAGGGDAGPGGGTGGYVEAEYDVTEGEVLYLYVGGQGGLGFGGGGWPNGGDGGDPEHNYGSDGNWGDKRAGGGGGSTDVRQSSSISDSIVGAGGGGGSSDSGAAGGDGGGAATDGEDNSASGGEGGGGNAGNDGEDGDSNYTTAGSGSAAASGGGGGGFLGGNAGGVGGDYDGAGGGGGDGHTSGVVNATATTAGGNTGDGQIEIVWTIPAPTLDNIDPLTDRELTLEWTNNETYDSINIYRATASGSTEGDYTLIANVAGSQTSYTDTGLPDGERYYYRLAGVYNGNVGELSNELNEVTNLPAPGNVSSELI